MISPCHGECGGSIPPSADKFRYQMNNEEFYNKYDATILGNVKILGFLPCEFPIIFAFKDKIQILPFELESKHLIFILGLDPSLANDHTREYIYRESFKFGPMQSYYVDEKNNVMEYVDYLDLDGRNQRKYKRFYRKLGEQ